MQQNNFFQKLLMNPKVRYGGYAGVITLAAIIVILILNLVIQQFGWQIDLTDRGVYTLSDQTTAIIDELDDEVTIYLLASRNETDDQILEALRRYEAATPLIRIEIVDAETNPAFVEQYDPEGDGLRNGSVIVASGDKFRSIAGIDLYSLDTRNPSNPSVLGLNVERRITNALIFVATGRTPIIYQTQGRQEIDVNALGRLSEELQNANFELRDLNLVQAPQIPEDASVLLMLRPVNDLSASDIEKVRTFLADGGTALFALDPRSGPMPGLADLLAGYGIGIPYGFIGETNNDYNTGNLWQTVPAMQDHPVVQPLLEHNQRVVFPEYSRPILQLDSKPRGVNMESILQTSTGSFFRTDTSITAAEMTASDQPGPFSLAQAAIETEFTTSEEITRIVVLGNAGFLSPQDLYGTQYPPNLDFFINALNWLQDQEETITVRPKTTMQFPMQMTGRQQLIFSALFTVVIPLAIFIAGLVIWLRRRHR